VAIPTDSPPLGYMRLALIVLTATAAFVLDEPAAAAVDATPSSLRRRTAHRAAAALLPLSVWIVAVLALGQRHGSTPSAGLLLEGAGALSLAVALAAVLRRHGQAEPGDVVACGLGATLLGVLLLDPPPHSVQLFPDGDGWTASTVLWGGLTLAAAGLTVIGSEDPFLRRRRRRSPRRPRHPHTTRPDHHNDEEPTCHAAQFERSPSPSDSFRHLPVRPAPRPSTPRAPVWPQ
jgi:hypothetical protein